MRWALSTRWNARRHSDGQRLVDEIRNTGFNTVELGYDLTRDLVPGIETAVARGDIRVASVHNYCPVPMGAPRGHPELFTLADPDPGMREKAVRYTAETVRFAAGLGARLVVVHAGYVRVRSGTPHLYRLAADGRRNTGAYARAQARLDRRRARGAPQALEWIRSGLEALIPVLDETGVRLGLENLPFWEAVPSEVETADLIGILGAGRIGYWHDVGHGQLREALGYIRHDRLLERMRPFTVGAHIHDARAPAEDHLLPTEGEVNFAAILPLLPAAPAPLVMEPGSSASAEALRAAAIRLETLASDPATGNNTPAKGNRPCAY